MARVLFICPITPAPTGVGLAQRAAVGVEGLHRAHELTVAVVPPAIDRTALDWTATHARRVHVLTPAAGREGAASWIRSGRGRTLAAQPLPALARAHPPLLGERLLNRLDAEPDAVVVMRSYLAGVALPFLERGIPAILDADDDDARTYRTLARLDPAYGLEVEAFSHLQEHVFPWFEHVLFASLDDATPRHLHLANAVRLPPPPPPARPLVGDGTLNVLFVGHSGYLPNRDALGRIERGIVPAILGRGQPVRLLHPGPGDDLRPFYRRAHVAVVPLRAGGGTRIKVLEAFAHGVTVVATPTGAAGLAVRHGEHLHVTPDDDDDQAFAGAVLDLARDLERRAAMANAARQFVATHHDHRAVGLRLAELTG
ncbi:MAG TPA: glycosyltransferase [Acidimicrobiales bacterium]|nr:glycosyltransferase [Acidimicrobiales bacterium]